MKKYRYILLFFLFFELINLNAEGSNWWRLYFTSPGKNNILLNSNNPESGLVKIINNTKKYFYGAFYDLSSEPVIKALINAKKRGIDIKLVTDRDNFDKNGIHSLIKSGINIIPDNKRSLMHNKFAIIDEKFVWTGSYNTTKNCTYKNNNNAIMIYSTLLVKIYLNKFNEMFQDKIFSNKKENGPFQIFRKKYYVKIEDTHVNVYFSPEDNIERIIIKRLEKAKESIYFMAFSFTSDKIGETIIKKYKEGVKVYGLFEKRGARSRDSEYIKMKIEGLPVHLDKNRYIMHHKVMIIDGTRVITGSYNFSKNANYRNDENILIIDNKEIAGEYLKEFYRLY